MILMALEDVRPGMALGRAIHNKEGHTLLGAGMALSREYVSRLRELGYWAVWIDDEDTRDIVYRDVLSDGTRLATTGAVLETFTLTSHEVRTLRTASVQKIRDALENSRFARTFQDHPVIARLTGHVDAMVGEVLNRAVLTGLGALRSRDMLAFDHAMDVAVTGTMIGRLIGYDRETLRKLAVGCLLHDIGKIFVDDALLDRPERLSPEDEARIREHATLGYLFIRDNLRLGLLAAHVAYQHHERQDGEGYPRGLTGTNRIVRGVEVHVPGRINPMGEIAAIANSHALWSADVPNRPALPADQVWHKIKEAGGSRFNREMVELFLGVLPPFPVGTQVVVTSRRFEGFRGVVVRAVREALSRPLVRLLEDAEGRRLEAVEVDLDREDDIEIRGAIRRQAPAHLMASAPPD